MKICPKCGNQLADNISFCTGCGANMSDVAPQQSDFQQPNYQQPNYQQPNYQQPNYQQPNYQQPNYQQPNYQQPNYQQPNYQQPNYQQPNYQQPNYQQQFGGGYKAPITERSIGMCILLSIVTCGIYGLYWYFCIVNDLNTASQQQDDKGPGMILLLSIVTCGIYSWIWLYKAGEKVNAIKQFNGEPASDSSVTYILLAIFGLGIVDYCLIQTELNKVAMYKNS